MPLIISDSLKKQIADFYSSLTKRDLEMLEVQTKNWTANLRDMAKRQPSGSLAGRLEDIQGHAPNEVESDDANP